MLIHRTNTLLTLFASSAIQVAGAPAVNSCNAVVAVVNVLHLNKATPFCSSYLHIPVKTTTITTTAIPAPVPQTPAPTPKTVVPIPPALLIFAAPLISQGCSCLSIPTSTSTAYTTPAPPPTPTPTPPAQPSCEEQNIPGVLCNHRAVGTTPDPGFTTDLYECATANCQQYTNGGDLYVACVAQWNEETGLCQVFLGTTAVTPAVGYHSYVQQEETA